MKITEPGFYQLSESDYFADPCPTPSLTQTIAKLLVSYTPLHAWAAHPRLNPAYQERHDDRFDLGHLAHRLFLGRGKDCVIIEAHDWRTAAARERRDRARASGQTPVLRHQYERALLAYDALQTQAAQLLKVVSTHGDPQTELTAIWLDGCWMRTKLDLLTADKRVTIDYKTTGAAIARDRVDTKAMQDGWDVQAATHEAALNALDPKNAGKREHFFLMQELEPPYVVHACQAGEAWLNLGRQKLKSARAIWQRCLNEKWFPGPAAMPHRLEVPPWAIGAYYEPEGEPIGQREVVES